jgi:HEAT repeat protein
VHYALDALVKCPGRTAVAMIHKLAREGDGCVRANLAGSLYRWRNPAAPRLLRRMARDQDYCVRRSVAQSLGALCLLEDLPLLRKLSQDSNADVRLEAVWAVGLYRRKEDIPLLKRMATDQCDRMRTVAAMALTRVMRRTELERWLDLEDRRLSFEVLREVDFALYAPKWAKKTHSRVDDKDIRFELGVAWFGTE